MKVISQNRKSDLKAFRWEKLRNRKKKALFGFNIYLLFGTIKVVSAYCRKLVHKIQKSKRETEKHCECPGTFLLVFVSQCIFHHSHHVFVHLINNFHGPCVPGAVLGRHFFLEDTGQQDSFTQFCICLLSLYKASLGNVFFGHL